MNKIIIKKKIKNPKFMGDIFLIYITHYQTYPYIRIESRIKNFRNL